MKILVTGGCGFIGSNFINHMFKKYSDCFIVNIDAMYYCASVENVEKIYRDNENYVFVKGNVNNMDLLLYVFDTYKPEYIIHFAAQSHVQTSFSDALLYTQDNVLGTHNLLEVCRKNRDNIKKIIHVSTDEVYGESMLDKNEKEKTEQSILCPTNPYAATKAGAELLAQSYNHSFGLPIIITRGNNVYGSNQYPEKLIPKFIKLLKENKPVTIQGDGSCVRAFLHVDDTARAFETIIINGKIGEIYNIGCDDGMEYSVLDIAKILIKLVKKTDDFKKWITYVDDRPFNDKRYYISNQKLKDLNWSPKITFDEGIINCCN
tara:strand:- start:601 stop:1557 length:957 start_codon:yes stop_codon:yes gene_type:complete